MVRNLRRGVRGGGTRNHQPALQISQKTQKFFQILLTPAQIRDKL